MPTAEWILTFDDGPLPSDVTTWTDATTDSLLDPLRSILATLAVHPAGPIPAVFFLRGPAYPWVPEPPLALFKKGVDLILGAGHFLGLHCYSHEPDLWWNWLLRANDIAADLDRCAAYFGGMQPHRLSVFRPPYGQGGPPGMSWARHNAVRWTRWDVDTEDWLHHPDVNPLLRRFVNDPAGHLRHITDSLPFKMWLHTWWPGANDFLMHVSVRTASYLSSIVDRICEVTRSLGHDPRFVVPDEYLHP